MFTLGLLLCSCSGAAKETASSKNSVSVSPPHPNLSDSAQSSSEKAASDEASDKASDEASSDPSSSEKSSSGRSSLKFSSSKPSSLKPSSSKSSSSKSSSSKPSSSKPSSSKPYSSKPSSSSKSSSGPTKPNTSVNQSVSGQSQSSHAASSKVDTVIYKVDFKNTVSGYITHYNTANFGFKTDRSGFTSCDDFYIALTAGTNISCKKDFAFFCYDDNFLLNTDIMIDSGLTLNFNKPEIKPGTYTLSDDCYVRFSVKGSLSDIKLAVPKGHESLISAGSRKEIETMPTIKIMRENLNGRNSSVNYIFITDLHYGKSLTTENGAALLAQVETAVALANSVDSIDFICIGGDTTTGMYETKDEAIKYTTEILEPLKQSKKPVFILMGNHDDNSYHRFTYDVYYPDRIISDKDWNDKVIKPFCPDNIVKDSGYKDSKYYYYDLANKKTRIICLDAVDYRAKYDANGVITELPIKDASAEKHVSKYWSGCSWWGYSDDQIEWLITEAMTAGNDWNYVFLSHMGIDKQTNAYGYETKNGAELRKIISAYQNKTGCRIGTNKTDFSKTKGKILAYQFGHIHNEIVFNSSDIDLWQICTATASIPSTSSKTDIKDTSINDKTLDWKLLDRELGTDSAACFDVMSVDVNKIQKWNIGGGNDVEVNQ